MLASLTFESQITEVKFEDNLPKICGIHYYVGDQCKYFILDVEFSPVLFQNPCDSSDGAAGLVIHEKEWLSIFKFIATLHDVNKQT